MYHTCGMDSSNVPEKHRLLNRPMQCITSALNSKELLRMDGQIRAAVLFVEFSMITCRVIFMINTETCEIWFRLSMTCHELRGCVSAALYIHILFRVSEFARKYN